MQEDSGMSLHPPQSRDESKNLASKASEPSAILPANSSSQTVQQDPEVARPEEADPKEPLESFDWGALEERYHAKMRECQRTEDCVYADFATWIKVRRRFWYSMPSL